MSAADPVILRLRALALSFGPLLLAGCSCPNATYTYDRTIRLDPATTDVRVQEALAAGVGDPLDVSLCSWLCNNQQDDVTACERAERDADPAVICHMSGTDDCGGVGRRPPGFRDLTAGPSRDPRGAFLARSAELEAASVHAFVLLARELESYSAPSTLVELARRAAIEELGHAKAMAHLARSFGGAPQPPRIQNTAPRSAFEMALDNAVEGCVHETLGALIAFYQANRAANPEVRHVLAHIAFDELGHAELSWRIAGWFDEVGSARERAQARRARNHALAGLRTKPAVARSRLLTQSLGVPDADQQNSLVAQLHQAAWS